jgi:hypothetical protein
MRATFRPVAGVPISGGIEMAHTALRQIDRQRAERRDSWYVCTLPFANMGRAAAIELDRVQLR